MSILRREPIGALCNALCNGLHSARPLIPCVVRGSRTASLRPRPPYETSRRGRSGSDPVHPRTGDEGSADGRGGPGARWSDEAGDGASDAREVTSRRGLTAIDEKPRRKRSARTRQAARGAETKIGLFFEAAQRAKEVCALQAAQRRVRRNKVCRSLESAT
jgi:hypothetical protein